MSIIIDPSGDELIALSHSAAWAGARVLEIGCGEGRLTLRLASFGPSRIDAFDPDPARVRLARHSLPSKYRRMIHYSLGRAERIRHPNGVFDVAIFSWAL